MTSGFDAAFDHSNISEGNEIPGSQTESQRRQIQGGARPLLAAICAAKRHTRPRLATSGDLPEVPPKQPTAHSDPARSARPRRTDSTRRDYPDLAGAVTHERPVLTRPLLPRHGLVGIIPESGLVSEQDPRHPALGPPAQRRTVLHAHQRVLGQPEAQFGPVRTFVMGGSDHPNHTVLACKLQEHLRWRNANARHPDVLAAQRRERARIRSQRQQRWGRPKIKAA
jgi:hypothetical protein